MTDDELDAIEARANAATPGPWLPSLDTWPPRRLDGSPRLSEITHSLGMFPGDMAFIAAARTDVPALIAEIRRLRALLDNQ